LDIYNESGNNPVPANFEELLADLSPDTESGKSAVQERKEIGQEIMLKYEEKLIKEQGRVGTLQSLLIEEQKHGVTLQSLIERLFKRVLKYQMTPDDLPPNKGDKKYSDSRLFFRHLKNNVLQERSICQILRKERENQQIIDTQAANLKTILGLNANDKVPTD
jgi:hypothetical protein